MSSLIDLTDKRWFKFLSRWVLLAGSDLPAHGLYGFDYHRGRAAAKNFNRMRPFAQSDQQPVLTGVLKQAIDLSHSVFEYSKE